MNDVARISFERGALLMPVRDAYDRELVFQEAEAYAREHLKPRKLLSQPVPLP